MSTYSLPLFLGTCAEVNAWDDGAGAKLNRAGSLSEERRVITPRVSPPPLLCR